MISDLVGALRAMLSDLVPALRALFVALAGAAFALSWFRGGWELGAVLLVALVLLGIGAAWIGDAFLPQHPVAA
ncbi:MAG: hypothetical protein ACRDRT_07915, partial [Pseudonocardiaceae bacterium]